MTWLPLVAVSVVVAVIAIATIAQRPVTRIFARVPAGSLTLISIGALISLLVLLTGCGVDDPYQHSATATSPSPSTTTTTTATTATTGTDAEEAQPEVSPAQRSARRSALRAARLFLDGYLPYSYGKAKASAIRAATPMLLRELAKQPPRVPPDLTDAKPEVTSLRASGQTRDHVYFLAQINDGHTGYATTLTAQRRGLRWLISEVQ